MGLRNINFHRILSSSVAHKFFCSRRVSFWQTPPGHKVRRFRMDERRRRSDQRRRSGIRIPASTKCRLANFKSSARWIVWSIVECALYNRPNKLWGDTPENQSQPSRGRREKCRENLKDRRGNKTESLWPHAYCVSMYSMSSVIERLMMCGCWWVSFRENFSLTTMHCYLCYFDAEWQQKLWLRVCMCGRTLFSAFVSFNQSTVIFRRITSRLTAFPPLLEHSRSLWESESLQSTPGQVQTNGLWLCVFTSIFSVAGAVRELCDARVSQHSIPWDFVIIQHKLCGVENLCPHF